MKSDSKIYEMGGVITEADGEHCTVRLRMPAGIATADQLIAAAELAKKYGPAPIILRGAHCRRK